MGLPEDELQQADENAVRLPPENKSLVNNLQVKVNKNIKKNWALSSHLTVVIFSDCVKDFGRNSNNWDFCASENDSQVGNDSKCLKAEILKTHIFKTNAQIAQLSECFCVTTTRLQLQSAAKSISQAIANKQNFFTHPYNCSKFKNMFTL